MADLPLVTPGGDAEERGLAHGRQLKERIHRTFDFYQRAIFLNSSLTQEQIQARAGLVKKVIEGFEPAYITEIEAIADGAEIDSWKIYVLNARTEILNAPLAECTSIYFAETALLGQTWDWIRELEELVVVFRYEYDDGRIITTLSEPGMLAKIGMNNSGLGVCLNFLVSSSDLNGLPVHVLLRAVLECKNIDDARRRIENSGMGKSSHLLVGDSEGRCFGMEFASGGRAELGPQNGALVHTNHCIADGMQSAMIPTSEERFSRAGAHLRKSNGHGMQEMQDILLDNSCGADSIQSDYHPEELMGGLEVGTCATVVMDLQNHRFFARRGPGTTRDFQCFE